MEKTSVAHELELTVTTQSKRQKVCKALGKYKSDTSQLLKSLHDHLDKVVDERFKEVEVKEKEHQVLTLKLGEIKKQIEFKTDKLKAVEIEACAKEKELDLLRNQIKLEEEKLIEVRKSVKNTQSELALKKKELRQRSNVIIKHEQHSIGEETELSSVSLGHHDVSRALRATRNPTEYVLDLVEREIRNAHQREESGLQNSVVENLILFLEELEDIGGSVKPQLQLKATQVATLWKGMIRIEAPRSCVEALTFLLFVVAYGLESLINEEETALLATSVFHYKQGPRIFHSLGLKLQIPEFVVDLITTRQYIPAVRLICLLKLTDYSPSNILMKEIIDLRRATLEKAENNDVGRLRAILELVADYKLDIDIPGDLITKLMLPRENSTPPVLHCSVTHRPKLNISSSDQEATFSPNVFAATRSNVDLRAPKREFKPFVNSSANCRY